MRWMKQLVDLGFVDMLILKLHDRRRGVDILIMIKLEVGYSTIDWVEIAEEHR